MLEGDATRLAAKVAELAVVRAAAAAEVEAAETAVEDPSASAQAAADRLAS